MTMSLVVRKEVQVRDASGSRTEWQEVKESRPGDTLMYVVTYKNAGKVDARGWRIVDPVPEGTGYIAGSAEGRDAAVTFSIDGKNFQEPAQLKYKVREAGGAELLQAAAPETYTHIQWKLGKPVPPGGTGTVSFKVKVR